MTVRDLIEGIVIDAHGTVAKKTDEGMKNIDMLASKLISDLYTPKHIIYNWRTDETIVIWKDGSKTTVKLSEDDTYNPYTAFTAALAKRILGSNTKIKKIVDTTESPYSTNPRRNAKRVEFLIDKCTPRKRTGTKN